MPLTSGDRNPAAAILAGNRRLPPERCGRMSSYTLSPAAAVLFASRPPRPSRLPLSPPKLRVVETPRLRLSVSSSHAGRRRRKGKRGGGGDAEDAFLAPAPPAVFDIEADVYEFMRRSANPNDFPTKEELLAGGRADLVEAIVTEGGWLAFGWDLDEDASRSPNEDSRMHQERLYGNGALGVGSEGQVDTEVSSSGRSMRMEDGEGAGTEGILRRLEKQRSTWAYTGRLKDKEVKGRSSGRNLEHDIGDGINGMRNLAPGTWRLQSLGSPPTEFEAAKIVPSEGRKQFDQSFIHETTMGDEVHKASRTTGDTVNGRTASASDFNEGGKSKIHLRLQHLDSELKSVLNQVRSSSNVGVAQKAQENSLKELHRLSDALEFQETEIMNARDKLRTARAKLAVLEGKMTLEIIEAHKIMDDKHKRLDAVRKALHHLCTACVVWPNSASEVLLAGSFDGWTTQRTMERSSAGIFSLHLKLYPGRYEIKFIVDGVWTVDPLRPIVNNNGHENNLLLVP